MFSSNTVSNKIVLVLDVQSSIVRGSLILIQKGTLPVVLFSYGSNIDYKVGNSDEYFIKSTLSSIKETIQASLRYLHLRRKDSAHIPHKVFEVHYALSSPWIISEAKILTSNYEKETEITQKLICDLIDSDRKKIAKDRAEPTMVIEQKIFDVKLNHYSINDWEGKKTKVLDVAFTVSVAGTKMIEYFVEQCAHIINRNKIKFHSSLLLQYIGIEEVLEPGQSYCLVHVHGDESDVSIVKQKSCVFFGSFSYGTKTLIDQISRLSKTGKQIAESILVLYTGEKLQRDQNQKDIEIVEGVAREWSDKLKNLIVQSKNEVIPPMSIIVTACAHDDYFVKVLKRSYPGLNVYILSIDDLISHVEFDGTTDKRRLTALHAIAIHSLLG